MQPFFYLRLLTFSCDAFYINYAFDACFTVAPSCANKARKREKYILTVKKIFLEKCIWAYERVLERRHDLKLRFLMLVNADLPELKYADLQYLDQKLGYDMSEHDEVQFEKK